jgi:excisionase family DNA binding protein
MTSSTSLGSSPENDQRAVSLGENVPEPRSIRPELLDEVHEALAHAAERLAYLRASLVAIDGSSSELTSGRPGPPILLSVPQACRLLACGKSKLYELMQEGLLPFVSEARGHRRIEYRALEAFVKRLRARRRGAKAA